MQTKNVKFNYRPQRSCEGYVFIPVCHSFHRGVYLSACWDTTPWRHPPPGGSTPSEVHPPGGIPLDAHTLPGGNPQEAPPEAHPPRRHPLGGNLREAPPPEAPPPPPPGDGCRCRRYASYWNAFSLKFNFTDIS